MDAPKKPPPEEVNLPAFRQKVLSAKKSFYLKKFALFSKAKPRQHGTNESKNES
jgi:hypothetical protein